MRHVHSILAAAVGSIVATASAGTFTTITIDGDMADWASVPILHVDPTGDGNPIDIGGVQMANDADNLYIRVSYATPTNPNLGPSIYLAFDTDSNVATGFNIYGMNVVGSEAGYQNDFPFDQRTGFNVGSLSAPANLSPVDWGDPGHLFSSQEYSIPRNLAFATDSAPVFANPGFNLMLWTDSSIAIDTTPAVPYVFASPIVTASWANPSSGAWSGTGNWSTGTVPNDATTNATFAGAIAASSTVTVDGDYTVNNLTFDNATARYTLTRSAATSSLTVAGAVTVTSGTHTLAVDTKAGSIDVSAAGVKLDVSNSSVAVDYTGASSYAALAAAVTSGKLVSTVGSSTRTVGLVEASELAVTSFGDLSVDSTAVLARGTLKGDADLNLTVNFDDLLKLAQSYGGTGKHWINGDTDYDGDVDFDDLLSLAQNYGSSALSGGQIDALASIAGTAFLGDWNFAQSLAPEPASLAMIGLLGAASRRRRMM